MMAWEHDSAEVGGHHVAWRHAGAGPLLVYLHDMGADTVAAPVFDDLAVDHEVVLVDLPGYGRSGPPTRLSTAPVVAALFAALLEALDRGPALLAGTSIGGWFAVETALEAPNLVRGLLLADAAGLHVPEDYLLALYASGAATASWQHLLMGAFVPDSGRSSHSAVDGMPPALAAATVGPLVADLAAAAASSMNPHTVNPRLAARLRAVRCPAVVLWGEHDALIPLAHGRAFAAGIPDAELVVCEGSGHLLALHAPAAFAAAVRRLGARLGGRRKAT